MFVFKMSELKSLTGRWKGEFTLGPEYGSEVGKSFNFILDIQDENGTFSGTCIDDETDGKFSEPIIVTGFWNNEVISFIKQYPFLYYTNDDGEIIIDREQKHPEITYTGEYDNALNKFSGDFELTIGYIPLPKENYAPFDPTNPRPFREEDYLETLMTGTWSMQRIE